MSHLSPWQCYQHTEGGRSRNTRVTIIVIPLVVSSGSWNDSNNYSCINESEGDREAGRGNFLIDVGEMHSVSIVHVYPPSMNILSNARYATVYVPLHSWQWVIVNVVRWVVVMLVLAMVTPVILVISYLLTGCVVIMYLFTSMTNVCVSQLMPILIHYSHMFGV